MFDPYIIKTLEERLCLDFVKLINYRCLCLKREREPERERDRESVCVCVCLERERERVMHSCFSIDE